MMKKDPTSNTTTTSLNSPTTLKTLTTMTSQNLNDFDALEHHALSCFGQALETF